MYAVDRRTKVASDLRTAAAVQYLIASTMASLPWHHYHCMVTAITSSLLPLFHIDSLPIGAC